MARINGTFSGSSGQYPYIDYTVGSTGQDSGGTYHNVTVALGAHKTSATPQTYKQSTPVSLTVNGVTSSATVYYDMRNKAAGYEQTLISAYTVKIYHQAATVISLSASVDLSGTSAKQGSVSGTISLPAISVSSPTISSVSAAVTGTSLGSTVYASGKNGCKLTANGVSAGTGASITGYAWYLDGVLIAQTDSSTGNYTFSAAVIKATGSHTLKCTVTNSNGKTASAQTTITVSAYSTPKISSMVSQRSTSGGSASDDGTYALCKATFSFTALGSNTCSMAIKVYSGSSVIGTKTGAASNTAYVVASGLSTESSYVVRYEVTDKFGTVIANDVISTSFFTMDVSPSGKSVGFGVTAGSDNHLRNGMVLDQYGNIYFDGGNQTANRHIYFRTSGGTYEHNVSLYGGSPDSAVAIGIYDITRDEVPFAYLNGTPALRLGSTNVPIRLNNALGASDGSSPVCIVPYISLGSVNYKTAISEWLKKIISSFNGRTSTAYVGRVLLGTHAFAMGYVYDATAYANGLPQYAFGLFMGWTQTSNVIAFRCAEGVIEYYMLNRTTV